jgi:uncharacterized protein DUF4268
MTTPRSVVLPVSRDLREAWPEESGFARWLCDPQHLKLVNDAVGFELECAELEFPVGSSYVDIRCNVAGEGTCVIIELQLERTDDPHLGQLLGNWGQLDDVVVIWIAKKFLPRQIAVFEKLNRKKIGSKFFAIEVTVLQSPRAEDLLPIFNVVAKPSGAPRKPLPPGARHAQVKGVDAIRLRYWTALKQVCAQLTDFRFQKPSPACRLRSGIGRKGYLVEAVIRTATSTVKPTIAVQLAIKTADAAEAIAALKLLDWKLCSRIDLPLHWHLSPRLKAAKVYVTLDADFTDESTWQMQFAWLTKYALLFHGTFRPLVRRSRVDPVAKPNSRASHRAELNAGTVSQLMQGADGL